ncbi:MAG: hypothetical protein R3C44_23735 [Chloroflexota bacterium]
MTGSIETTTGLEPVEASPVPGYVISAPAIHEGTGPASIAISGSFTEMDCGNWLGILKLYRR